MMEMVQVQCSLYQPCVTPIKKRAFSAILSTNLVYFASMGNNSITRSMINSRFL